MTTTYRTWRCKPRLVSLLLLGALAGTAGCGPAAEGDFEGPAGFSRAESAESALAPATLTRERGRLVTRALLAAEHRDPAASGAGLPPLGAELGGHYDEGLRLVAAANPAAFVELEPLGVASHAPARLRHDGALVAYDEAYPGVSAALGASDERVETRLRFGTLHRIAPRSNVASSSCTCPPTWRAPTWRVAWRTCAPRRLRVRGARGRTREAPRGHYRARRARGDPR